MWYSLERLESGEWYIQSTEQRLKHGAKGKALLLHCTYQLALAIIQENPPS
jgi:hypothetical protein